MSVAGQTSQQIRKSPSGPLSDIQLPIYGTNAITVQTSPAHALLVGSLGDAAVADGVGEFEIPEPGILRRLVVQNAIKGGTASFNTVYSVYKRVSGGAPVLIATVDANGNPSTAQGTLASQTFEPLVIPINVAVRGPIPAAAAAAAGFPPGVAVAGDLIQVQFTCANLNGGSTPIVRTELLWAPGATF